MMKIDPYRKGGSGFTYFRYCRVDVSDWFNLKLRYFNLGFRLKYN